MSLPQTTPPLLKRSTSAPSASTPMERSVAVERPAVSTHFLKHALTCSSKEYKREMAVFDPSDDHPQSEKSKIFDLLKYLSKILEERNIEFAFFGSMVLMMMGIFPFRRNSDVDIMINRHMTRTFLRILGIYGSCVVTPNVSGSTSDSRKWRKVTTITFFRGKGTPFEADFGGVFTEISFDIVEIPTRMSFPKAVEMMNGHVQSWIATSMSTFHRVPSVRSTVDITLFSQVIHLMKGWKYMIRPEYRDQFLLDAPVKLQWYYFKHLQLAIRHDDICVMCQEEFLPDDKVMHLSCGCRYGHVGHVKCFMPWLIKRLNGILAARRGTGSPDRPDGKCGQCDRHFIMNESPESMGIRPFIRSDGDEIVKDYKIPTEVFSDIFRDIFH